MLKFCNFGQSFSIRKYKETIEEESRKHKKKIEDKKIKSAPLKH
jgi:hypothetical protein